jgi:hypothetical protein
MGALMARSIVDGVEQDFREPEVFDLVESDGIADVERRPGADELVVEELEETAGLLVVADLDERDGELFVTGQAA